MNETIIAVGNGGYNLAKDLISAGLFTDARLIVCDTDQTTLENASANGAKTRLLGELNECSVVGRLYNWRNNRYCHYLRYTRRDDRQQICPSYCSQCHSER